MKTKNSEQRILIWTGFWLNWSKWRYVYFFSLKNYHNACILYFPICIKCILTLSLLLNPSLFLVSLLLPLSSTHYFPTITFQTFSFWVLQNLTRIICEHWFETVDFTVLLLIIKQSHTSPQWNIRKVSFFRGRLRDLQSSAWEGDWNRIQQPRDHTHFYICIHSTYYHAQSRSVSQRLLAEGVPIILQWVYNSEQLRNPSVAQVS